MGIYIPGMEMPTNADMAPTAVWVYPNGSVVVFKGNGNMRQYTEAVPVPPHGRLGDLDKLEKHFINARLYHSDDSNRGPFIAAGISQCLDILNGSLTPTIIPAEEGET